MNENLFHQYISKFFKKYLKEERGVSTNTLEAYNTTFKLLFQFITSQKQISISNLTISYLNRNLILDFLNYLEKERNCSAQTRNLRLSFIKSFCKFLQLERVECIENCNQILGIWPKKSAKLFIPFLTIAEVNILLNQPNRYTKTGYRDYVLLKLIYETGCRIQEVLDLNLKSILHHKNPVIKVIGKGNKSRIVPINQETYNLLKEYIQKNKLEKYNYDSINIFCNSRRQKITRSLAHQIIKKNLRSSKMENKFVQTNKVSCHTLRHSKAMHLLKAGIDLVIIRDFLGHASITTTEKYARNFPEDIYDVIKDTYSNINQEKEEALWNNNTDVLNWLQEL